MERPLRSGKLKKCEMPPSHQTLHHHQHKVDEDVPQEHQTNTKQTKKQRNKQQKQQKKELLPVGVEPTLSA